MKVYFIVLHLTIQTGAILAFPSEWLKVAAVDFQFVLFSTLLEFLLESIKVKSPHLITHTHTLL